MPSCQPVYSRCSAYKAACDNEYEAESEVHKFITKLRGGYRGDGTTALPDGAAPPDPFVQVRGGFLRITRLRLVDGFGQFVDLLVGPNGQFQSAAIIKSDPMIVNGNDDLALLPPRFTSPMRLLFRFVDAKDSGKEAVSDPQGGNQISPVCGYLMPNHLDRSLEFFDVDGTNLGFVRGQEDKTLTWEEAPGQPATTGRDPALVIPNPHAGGIASTLVQWGIADAGVPGEQDNALQAMLRVIDSTLWSVDPYGHSGDEHLALLVGHPVVIVRARLTLQLKEPIRSEIANLAAIPVRLGALAHWQDGLFGYFLDDDYTHLYCSDAAAAGLARQLGPRQGFLGPINSVPDQLTNFAADTNRRLAASCARFWRRGPASQSASRFSIEWRDGAPQMRTRKDHHEVVVRVTHFLIAMRVWIGVSI